MSRIAMVVEEGPDLSRLAAVLRRLTGFALSEIVNRIKTRAPVIECELFGNDHDDIARILRELLQQLPSVGAEIRLFELPERHSFTSIEEEARQEISAQTLSNILASHDEEIARQRGDSEEA